MDTFDFSVAVLDSFRPFVRETPPEVLGTEDHTCLADFIYTWLFRGGGADVCQRDFVLLQIATQVIANDWHHFETALDYWPSGDVHIERRVSDIFPIGMGVEHPILDPNIFA